MNRDQDTDVIARRRYRVSGASDEAAEVILSISRPVKIESGDYECHYEIAYDGQRQSAGIRGIDEISALVYVLAMAGSWINGLNESMYEGRLVWLGGSDNLGLPRIEFDWPFLKREGT